MAGSKQVQVCHPERNQCACLSPIIMPLRLCVRGIEPPQAVFSLWNLDKTKVLKWVLLKATLENFNTDFYRWDFIKEITLFLHALFQKSFNKFSFK